MRVLHVMASGARGGGADHLRGLLPALRALGVDCGAAVDRDGPLAAGLRADGFAVAHVPLMGARVSLPATLRLAAAIRRAAADVVHLHGTRAAFFGALSRPLWGGGAAVYTAHGLAHRQARGRLRRRVLLAAEALACRADAVVSVAAADLVELRGRGLLPAGAGLHVPNVVDTRRFRRRPQGPARRRLGLAAGAFVVGTTARLVPQKGLFDLVAAVARLPGATLCVIGDGPQGPALRAAAAAAALPLHLAGSRDDVAACLPAFDLFALASHWEGEPIALLEAMAAGLPCVATATAGARELLAPAAAGALVPVGQPAALAAALTDLRAAPGRAAALGAAAWAAARRRSRAAQAAALLRLYRRLRP